MIDAYGNTHVFNAEGAEIERSAIGNRYCFQGREIDWETGLYSFRARWYDPDTGRWLSKDPIGIAGGLNQYVAFNNNPVNFVDPFGLETTDGDTIFTDYLPDSRSYTNNAAINIPDDSFSTRDFFLSGLSAAGKLTGGALNQLSKLLENVDDILEALEIINEFLENQDEEGECSE